MDASIEKLIIIKQEFAACANKWPEFVTSHVAVYDKSGALLPELAFTGFLANPRGQLPESWERFQVLSNLGGKVLREASLLNQAANETTVAAFARFVSMEAGWAREFHHDPRVFCMEPPAAKIIVRRFPADAFSHAGLALNLAIAKLASPGRHDNQTAAPDSLSRGHWKDSADSLPDGLYGPLEGTKAQLAEVMVAGKARNKTRQLDNKLLASRGKLWGRQMGACAFQLWFRDERRFLEAARKLASTKAVTA